jgi:hypothetical protein
MIFLAALLAANSYDPRLMLAGDAALVEKFATDVRACGFVVTVRDWKDGDMSPKPRVITTKSKVALSDKPIDPSDARLPCVLNAEMVIFRTVRP